MRLPTTSTKPSSQQAFAPRKRAGLLQLRLDSDSLPRMAATTCRRLITPWDGHDPSGLGLCCSLLPPPSYTKHRHHDTSTQNLAEYATLKRTFQDAANRCRQGLGREERRCWEDSARNLVTSQRLSTTSHRTPSDINLELAQRVSSSLHRAIPRRVRMTASRDSSTTLGPDDWWRGRPRL